VPIITLYPLGLFRPPGVLIASHHVDAINLYPLGLLRITFGLSQPNIMIGTTRYAFYISNYCIIAFSLLFKLVYSVSNSTGICVLFNLIKLRTNIKLNNLLISVILAIAICLCLLKSVDDPKSTLLLHNIVVKHSVYYLN
jgi:hypothetical protein